MKLKSKLNIPMSMKSLKLILLGAAATLAGSVYAQTAPQASPPSSEAIGPSTGAREFSIGASGSTSKDFDDSSGGVDLSLGYYYTDSLLASVRQNLNYVNPSTGSDSWIGWTRVALDQHFSDGAIRPFFGVNGGRIYGDAVHDSWTAGLETGAKFYIRPQTFVKATVEYGWLFDDGDDLDDRFDDGLVNWSVAVGFNF